MTPGDFNLAFEPAWPWSYPLVGPIAFAVVALLLVALTVWTYLGVQQANRRRIALVIALRLGALALTLCTLMRPSFAMTQLEGVDVTKLLVVLDRSASMKTADVEGKSTRWEQMTQLWESRDVQRRLQQLAAEQKIEVVRYHAAEDLRPFEPNAEPTGKRTDIGTWLQQLWQRHGHEKRLRGVVLLSDGADNGTKFSLQEKARSWRGVAPIHTFGVGNPNDPRFKKDIALTSLRVADDKPVPSKSKFAIKAVLQAPGFEKAAIKVTAMMAQVDSGKPHQAGEIPQFRIVQEKDQWIELRGDAPDLPGEYKLTLKVEPLPGDASFESKEISTFVQVMTEKIKVLWVDRPRVYEPTFAIRALAAEERFEVHFALPSLKEPRDPIEFYQLDKHYDVIVIGDISAQQFSMGQPGKVFEKIQAMVREKKTGLLMLGGTETFAKGGWTDEPAWMSMMPVDFKVDKASFVPTKVHVLPTEADTSYPFLRILSDKKKNEEFWTGEFGPIRGYSPLGAAVKDSTVLMKTDDGQNALVIKRFGEGRVAVFAADSTSKAWLGSKEAVNGYQHFWKHLAYWLSGQQDLQNQVWVSLDKRRINLDIDEPLSFSFGMRDKAGKEIPNVKFDVKVVAKDKREYPVRHSLIDKQHRGTFQGARETGETGEYELVVNGSVDKSAVKDARARFLVVSEDLEMLRPVADHDSLKRIAEASEGRFHLAEEQALLQYLDELRTYINAESRHKTTHWPDWRRLPASDGTRDQLAGIWGSFSLIAFVLFVVLLGGEWMLRRKWGMV